MGAVSPHSLRLSSPYLAIPFYIERLVPVQPWDILPLQTQFGRVTVFFDRTRIALLRFHESCPVQLSGSGQPILFLSALTGRDLDVACQNRPILPLSKLHKNAPNHS